MKGPLDGVKVIDLSLLLPGPLCSTYLGDMGAEVIKIENPRAVDGTRVMFKSESGFPGLYYMANRNKKAITLNLKKEKSRDILFKLLDNADILLEGFRPGALDEMGIGYDELKEKFPRLIYCGIYGYGESGQYRDMAGHDGNYVSLSGILEQCGEEEKVASLGIQVADIGGGTLVALASILAALYSREKTGKGQKIDVSMMEGSLQFLTLYAGIYFSSGKMPERGDGLLSGHLPNYSIYRTKEERFVFLGALEERFFRVFLRQSGLTEEIEKIGLEENNFPKIKEILKKYFLSKSISDLMPIFENRDACLTLIKRLPEVLSDAHLKERKMFFEFQHNKFGKIPQFASPFHFSETPCTYRNMGPEHGEHNEEIYKSIGFSKEELEKLKSEKVI
jgi:crotonobetainyl-CoA:carnitine CoA-transferase CaiB-like acyl-CoA transferase